MLYTKLVAGLLFLFAILSVWGRTIEEASFSTLKGRSIEEVVVFYKGENSRTLIQMESIVKELDLLQLYPQITFNKCNGDLAINKDEFEEASFIEDSYIFTSTPNLGIMKYTGPTDTNTFIRYLEFLYTKGNDNDILPFIDEFSFWELFDFETEPLPVVIMFSKSDCGICKRLTPGFITAATYYHDIARFMTIDCDDNDIKTSFCTLQSVSNYPAFVLYTGENIFKFDDDEKSYRTWDAFFTKNNILIDDNNDDDEDEEVVFEDKHIINNNNNNENKRSINDINNDLKFLNSRMKQLLEDEKKMGRMNKAFSDLHHIVKKQAKLLDELSS